MIQWRCIQYDIARGRIPKLNTVLRRLAHARSAGANALLLYMECTVQTRVFPGIGTGATVVTSDYIRDLAEMCQRQQVELIPLIQVLSHQGKLLSLERFAHLGELSSSMKRFAGVNNFQPHLPEARQKTKAWLDELLPLFPGPFVHLGLDEAFCLGVDRSRNIMARQGVVAVMVDYLGDLHQRLKESGKQMMIYADLLIHFPELRDQLPRDIVVTNWGYGRWEDVYEQDNRHFANHTAVTARAQENWVVGNNMAEYIFPPFERLEANTEIWLNLADQSQAQGYIISDWGSYENVNPHVLSVLGDLYVLWRIDDPQMTLETFLSRLSEYFLGRHDASFIMALSLMLRAQMNPDYFQESRLLTYLPLFPTLMLADPGSGSPTSQRMACLREEGLLAFESDMRKAVAAIDRVSEADIPDPDDLRDLRMLAQRLLLISLRARLWHQYAWDTGAIWKDRNQLEPRRRLLDEYQQLATDDLAWYAEHWNTHNELSVRDECLNTLQQARDVMIERIESLAIPNTKQFHP